MRRLSTYFVILRGEHRLRFPERVKIRDINVINFNGTKELILIKYSI